MPLTALFPDPFPDPPHQLLGKFLSRRHQQEEHHAFIAILRPPLTNTDAVGNFREERFDDAINLGGAEAYAGRVQHAISAAEK